LQHFLQNPVRHNAEYIGWCLCFYAVWQRFIFQIEAITPVDWTLGLFDTIAVLSGASLLQIASRKRLPLKRYLSKKAMSGRAFLFFLCVFFSAQLLYSLFGNTLELILELFGFTAMGSGTITLQNKTIWYFLYTAFFAPLGEEFIYRGFVLHRLERYGKVYAIVLSALLFSVMHGNFLQMIFAFLTGLVLGFVALEYSILWSILLHIINNFLYGEILYRILSTAPLFVQDYIYRGINIAFFAIGAFWLLHRRKDLQSYLHQNHTPKKHYCTTLTAIGILLFLLWGIYQGVCNITQLN